MSHDAEAIARLAKRRWRVALILTLAMLVVYFGFILMIAFAKGLMGARLSGGLTLGILLGVMVIVSAWLLTWWYTRWAHEHYDVELRRLSGGK